MSRARDVPHYLVVFAVGNLFGPRLLGRYFDTLGRKPMIAGTYILSGGLLVVPSILFKNHSLNAGVMIALTIVFFFAWAGASAAYLTVSEVFPMETRALCISVFSAVGTGVGGIIGPLVFSWLIKFAPASALAWAIRRLRPGADRAAARRGDDAHRWCHRSSSGSRPRVRRWRTSPRPLTAENTPASSTHGPAAASA